MRAAARRKSKSNPKPKTSISSTATANSANGPEQAADSSTASATAELGLFQAVLDAVVSSDGQGGGADQKEAGVEQTAPETVQATKSTRIPAEVSPETHGSLSVGDISTKIISQAVFTPMPLLDTAHDHNTISLSDGRTPPPDQTSPSPRASVLSPLRVSITTDSNGDVVVSIIVTNLDASLYNSTQSKENNEEVAGNMSAFMDQDSEPVALCKLKLSSAECSSFNDTASSSNPSLLIPSTSDENKSASLQACIYDSEPATIIKKECATTANSDLSSVKTGEPGSTDGDGHVSVHIKTDETGHVRLLISTPAARNDGTRLTPAASQTTEVQPAPESSPSSGFPLYENRLAVHSARLVSTVDADSIQSSSVPDLVELPLLETSQTCMPSPIRLRITSGQSGHLSVTITSTESDTASDMILSPEGVNPKDMPPADEAIEHGDVFVQIADTCSAVGLEDTFPDSHNVAESIFINREASAGDEISRVTTALFSMCNSGTDTEHATSSSTQHATLSTNTAAQENSSGANPTDTGLNATALGSRLYSTAVVETSDSGFVLPDLTPSISATVQAVQPSEGIFSPGDLELSGSSSNEVAAADSIEFQNAVSKIGDITEVDHEAQSHSVHLAATDIISDSKESDAAEHGPSEPTSKGEQQQVAHSSGFVDVAAVNSQTADEVAQKVNETAAVQKTAQDAADSSEGTAERGREVTPEVQEEATETAALQVCDVALRGDSDAAVPELPHTVAPEASNLSVPESVDSLSSAAVVLPKVFDAETDQLMSSSSNPAVNKVENEPSSSSLTEGASKVKRRGWTSGRDLLTQLRQSASSAMQELARPEIRSSLAEAAVAGVVILFATIALTDGKREKSKSQRR